MLESTENELPQGAMEVSPGRSPGKAANLIRQAP